MPGPIVRRSSLLFVIECFQSEESGAAAQLFFDPQQLVVFGDAIGAGGGASLDLARTGGYRQIGNERVFRFAGAVRDDRRIAVAAGEINGVESLTHRADLIDLN